MHQTPAIILAIDDEKDILTTFRAIFRKKYIVETASGGEEGLAKLKNLNASLVLLDLRLPGISGLETLKKIKKLNKDIEVVIISALKEVKSAVEAIKHGAYDYVVKPFDANEILNLTNKILEKQALIKENLYLKQILEESSSYCQLLGRTPIMKRLFELIETVAKTESTILITGESGTGKELVARAIHNQSKRVNQPFVVVNCAAIPESLLESELFGHERGAFTGALERKIGKFELADKGAVFLDEIGSMPPSMQAKLLRVLQDGVFERVGGTNSIHVDIRLIAASNTDFSKSITKGAFREDLYHRLNVIPIKLPPLRERKEDIPLLMEHFLRKFSRELTKKVPVVEEAAIEELMRYEWPGNVRELQNLIERMVVLAKEESIKETDLPFFSSSKANVTGCLKNTVAEFEKSYLKQVLRENGNNHSQAARILRIHRSTLLSKLKNYGLL